MINLIIHRNNTTAYCNDTRESIIEHLYVPCKKCNPQFDNLHKKSQIARKYLKFSKFYDIITLYSYNFNEKGKAVCQKWHLTHRTYRQTAAIPSSFRVLIRPK